MKPQKWPIDLPDEDWPVGGDITLDELLIMIPKLQKKYGKKAKVGFDAGANNINVIIWPTK